jgi:hypothetical protein
MRLLTFDSTLVPDGGLEIYSGIGALSKSTGKDAAGHAFHHFCLLQAGLIGAATWTHVIYLIRITDVHLLAVLLHGTETGFRAERERTHTNGKAERDDDDHTDTAGNDRSEDGDDKNKEGYVDSAELYRGVMVLF